MPAASQDRRIIRIQTWADYQEFDEVKKELENAFGLSTKAELFYPNKELAATGHNFAVPAPYEVFIQVITTVASIASLADILHRFLRKPVANPRAVGTTEPRSASLKLDGKEITVKGDWPSEELKLVLETFSKKMTDTTDLSLLEKAKRRELERELSEIERNLPSYEELVRIGAESRKKEWKKKHAEYQQRHQQLKARAEAIRELLAKDTMTKA